jgi:hypothetical protein
MAIDDLDPRPQTQVMRRGYPSSQVVRAGAREDDLAHPAQSIAKERIDHFQPPAVE